MNKRRELRERRKDIVRPDAAHVSGVPEHGVVVKPISVHSVKYGSVASVDWAHSSSGSKHPTTVVYVFCVGD